MFHLYIFYFLAVRWNRQKKNIHVSRYEYFFLWLISFLKIYLLLINWQSKPHAACMNCPAYHLPVVHDSRRVLQGRQK
jgi:hypothetical protein